LDNIQKHNNCNTFKLSDLIIKAGTIVGIGKKSNTIPVNSPLRLPHSLDSQLIDGGKVVSLTCLLLSTSRKIPGNHFRHIKLAEMRGVQLCTGYHVKKPTLKMHNHCIHERN
jgi:hypothetical protein